MDRVLGQCVTSTTAARNSVTVAGWTLVSRITGVLRVVVIGPVLGTTYFANTFQTSSWGRCAGPPWWRENGVALVRDADVSVMPCELVDQYGAGGHRQELSIVASSTRVRLLSPVVPSDGVTWLFCVVWGGCCGVVA
jgi:hypothetical protein